MKCACSCPLSWAAFALIASAGLAGIIASCERPGTTAAVKPAALTPAANEVVFKVEGLACEGCVADVTEELTSVPGVEKARVVLNEGRAYVTLASAEPASVEAMLEKVNANPSHKASVEAKGSGVK
jgi:copper chaperone CopZ